jgi:glycosyltransferase involved in cell wall biosynthesis
MLPPSPPRAERIPGLIVIIPAHNEDRFIGSVVLKSRQYVDTVIVVDDGSTDRTAQVAEAAGAIVIQHTVNK